MIQNNIQELINCYINAAIGYEEGLHDGDSSLADESFDEIERLFQEIKSLGEKGITGISKLLQHEKESVRLWASSHLLNYPEYESLEILEKIKNSSTILSLVAEVTLDKRDQGDITY